MANRLPRVEVATSGQSLEWLQPLDLQEAFRIQQTFVRPDFRSLFLTAICTVGPGTAFIKWVLPQAIGASLNENAAEAAACAWRGHRVVCLLFAGIALCCLISTACRNPGVVPVEPGNGSGGPAATVQRPSRTLVINGVPIKQRWCYTCRLYRPLRAKHCGHCDRCIFRFDHHCTWIGNCVGLGNYRSFLGLVSSAGVFFGHSALLTALVLNRCLHEEMAAASLVNTASTMVVSRWPCFTQACRGVLVAHGWETLYFAHASILCVALEVLTLYHLLIVGNNLTTNEHVRDYYISKNPYDAGHCENCAQVFCMPYGRDLDMESELQKGQQLAAC